MSFDGTSEVDVTAVPVQGWTGYSFEVTATGSDTLTIGGASDSSPLYIDNFSVTVVPEPATWAMTSHRLCRPRFRPLEPSNQRDLGRLALTLDPNSLSRRSGLLITRIAVTIYSTPYLSRALGVHSFRLVALRGDAHRARSPPRSASGRAGRPISDFTISGTHLIQSPFPSRAKSRPNDQETDSNCQFLSSGSDPGRRRVLSLFGRRDALFAQLKFPVPSIETPCSSNAIPCFLFRACGSALPSAPPEYGPACAPAPRRRRERLGGGPRDASSRNSVFGMLLTTNIN